MSSIKPEVPTLNAADDAQRRRLLLAGLQASGLVAGALSGAGAFARGGPLPTVPGATTDPDVRYKTSDTDGKLCTVSGAASGVLSGTAPGGVCSAYTPSQFAVSGSDAANAAAAVGFDLAGNQVRQIFPTASSSDATMSLKDALAQGDDLSRWVAAYLNAQISSKPGSKIKFPYGSATVAAKYGNADFLKFIKTYFFP